MLNQQHIFQKASLLALAAGFLFASCDKDDDPVADTNKLEVVSIEDLNSGVTTTDPRQADSVCFSLEKGQAVAASSADWDIKFKSTTITFGNGASGQVVEGVLSSYETAPESGYVASIGGSDREGNPSYYTYTGQNTVPLHAILMKPGRLIIVKTGKGKYAKIEMISYYKGNPKTDTPEFADYEKTRPADKHYTFKYVLQPNGSNTF